MSKVLEVKGRKRELSILLSSIRKYYGACYGKYVSCYVGEAYYHCSSSVCLPLKLVILDDGFDHEAILSNEKLKSLTVSVYLPYPVSVIYRKPSGKVSGFYKKVD